MILILLACTITPMCFVGVLGYVNARKTLESLRLDQLKSIADLKAKRIEEFFDEHRKHFTVAQQRPTLIKYAALLADFSGNPSDPNYGDIREELDRALKAYLPVYQFINVLLANPDGRIVYALNRFSTMARYGTSLSELMGEPFLDIKIRYSSILKNPAAARKFSILLVGPIQSPEERLIGFVAFQIDMQPIYELIQDTTGLGKTGETLIAKKQGDEALFLNPLRHDPDAALNRKVAFGEKTGLPIQEALKGRNGSGITVDYRGQKVIAAWRLIPALGWGMVAKIDIAEAFEPVAALRDFVLVLAIAVIVLSIFAAFVVARSFSAPIKILQLGAEEIGKGNLDYKVGTNTKDEIGQLGRAFDQMTERLKAVTASRDELDKEIKERRKVEKDLQKSMHEVGERIKELNCLFEISHVIERRRFSLEKILQEIVELIPSAMQYPEITGARIGIDDQEFATSNFKETPWELCQSIAVSGTTTGLLSVCYLSERPQQDEGPFLKEERDLIDTIAERIGRIAERCKAQAALVESEKRFRDLVENSLTGVSIIQDGQIVYQNPQQESLLGPLPRPVKLQDTESIHPDDRAKVEAFYQSVLAGQVPTGAMEFRFYDPAEKANRDQMKWVHCQANRIEYQGKDAILINMMDLTKTKELEHLLTIQDKMASLGRVAAGIAHEIRNPLSGINIYLNTLKKLHHQDGSEEKVEQILQHLQSASIKIESVIRRVMDFAKPSEPQLELIDINEPITDAVNLTAVTMRKSGIEIITQLEEGLPRSYADHNLIEQVVLNLLNNAAEAMQAVQTGKQIRVASSVEKNQIVIRVCDSGPGVPLAIRNKILDPYFTTKQEGTGIGLSFCHRIISDHGGSITISDCDRGGAEFRVELPINKHKGA